jgi:hypothetical protein
MRQDRKRERGTVTPKGSAQRIERLKGSARGTPRVYISAEPQDHRRKSHPVCETRFGSLYFGKAEDVLGTKSISKKYAGLVQLVFTSPPFPLASGKKYGNLRGDDYVRWLAGFAKLLKRYVASNGSIVMEVGNVWEPGTPTMSTSVMKALLRFLEEGELHLCEEFVWYNPARLPSPAQWVNIERSRVKDAFTRIWWMSPTERPKADNRRILRPYSSGMEKLIRTGKYNSGMRPSEHGIGHKSFAVDNGGAIPSNVFGGDEVPSLSNVLKVSNTRSNDRYQLFCRDNSITPHPARMPTEIAEFFIKFLTDERDIVLDPFAGSNTTGAAAERLKRRWISVEADWEYIRGAFGQFPVGNIQATSPEVLFLRGLPGTPPTS